MLLPIAMKSLFLILNVRYATKKPTIPLNLSMKNVVTLCVRDAKQDLRPYARGARRKNYNIFLGNEFARPNPRHGFGTFLRCSKIFLIVYFVGVNRLSTTSSHVIGVATGAEGLARTAYGATPVWPNAFLSTSIKIFLPRFVLRISMVKSFG